MATFDTVKLWYALNVAPNNTFATSNLKFQNATSPAGEELSLIYCNPSMFSKRATDVSEALAADPTSPDTGTAISDVVIRLTQEIKNGQPGASILSILKQMFYIKLFKPQML